MKRTGPAQPFALFLPACLLCFSACTSNGPRPTDPPPPPEPAAAAADLPEPEAEAPEEQPDPGPRDDSPMPYPEAVDTSGWEIVSGPDSLGAAAGTRPPAQALPPVSRPDGIVQRPRPKDLPDRVHVLLSRSAKPLALYSLGDMQILSESVGESGAGKTVATTRLVTLKGRFTIRRSGSGFAVEQAGKATQTTPARKLRLISVNPYNLIDVGPSVYRGSLHLIGEANGDIATVNVLGVEDYLRGVLPYELGTVDREALEALKAQAIVARTYAYKRMLRAGAGDFHIYSDVQDQVYKGVRGEYLLSDRAVWETRNMAVCHGDTLAICYYFSTCGGRTASKHEVWGGDSIPYLITRPDVDEMGAPFCQASRYSSWTQEWSQAQLTGILRRNLRSAGVADFPAFSSLRGFEVPQRATCGRIEALKILTDKGPILVKGDKVRWAMRPSASSDKILPSAFFTVKLAGGKITAQGKAFGHGVGLCQVGAIGRARADQDFRQIIEAYYTGVQVVEFK
ncbi:MAG TPA: SpoIID/LytB domain-containing protein [Fibrobacteria bacterium]|nr:SpoIID/LytB domain-containing protein [Fibrobacteria bacterium]